MKKSYKIIITLMVLAAIIICFYFLSEWVSKTTGYVIERIIE